MSEVSEAASHVDNVEPVGVVGMLKASQEQDAQRGMAVLVEVLRRLGKGVRKVERRQKLGAQLGPRRRRKLAGVARVRRAVERAEPVPRAAAVAPAAGAPKANSPAATPSAIGGVELTPEGFLVDASTWTPQVAEQLARSLGVLLTERHYQLIEFARTEYQTTGASPNIRRLSLGSGISTKELYQMFPRAPGKSTAMIAGLPKPVGCI